MAVRNANLNKDKDKNKNESAISYTNREKEYYVIDKVSRMWKKYIR